MSSFLTRRNLLSYSRVISARYSIVQYNCRRVYFVVSQRCDRGSWHPIAKMLMHVITRHRKSRACLSTITGEGKELITRKSAIIRPTLVNRHVSLCFRPRKMHVPSRSRAGPPTAHARGHAAGDVPQLQVAIEFVRRRSGTTGAAEDAGTSREGDALLYKRIRSKSRR